MVRLIAQHLKQNAALLRDGSGRLIIPLSYYYDENVDIGDEQLSCEQIIARDQLQTGFYAARFYIDAVPRLHRVVQAAFEVS
jgi:hypothetical protein